MAPLKPKWDVACGEVARAMGMLACVRSAVAMWLRWGLVALTACGRASEGLAWVPADAAVVRCSWSGRRPMPVALRDIPVPAPPTGLLAASVDPAVLDELGYQRNALVCASLVAPSREQITVLEQSAASLLQTYETVNRAAARVAGRCTCELARRSGLRERIADCATTPTVRNCGDDARLPQLQGALEPLTPALQAAAMPWIHWRLAGATDRPGWFVEHLPQLIQRHPGGTKAFFPGARAGDGRDPLVARLLDVSGVVAVLRQDSDRAVVVVREMDGQLIVDHFERAPMAPRLHALARLLEQVHADALVRALARPSSAAALRSPSDGRDLVQFDLAGLVRVRELEAATAPWRVAPRGRETTSTMGGDRADVDSPWIDGAIALVERDGETMEILVDLASPGRQWAAGLTDEPVQTLFATVERPRLPGQSEASATGNAHRLMGAQVLEWVAQGMPLAVDRLRRAASHAPEGVTGSQRAWTVKLPVDGSLTDERGGWGFSGLSELLSQRPYRVEGSLIDTGDRVRIVFKPR